MADELTTRLRSHLDAGDILLLKSIKHFWSAGRSLSKVKELLNDHEGWDSWLETNGFDKEDATKSLRLYENNPVWEELEKKVVGNNWN